MPAFAYTVTSFGGATLSGSPYGPVYFDLQNGPGATMEIQPIEALITGAGPQDVRGQPKASTWRLRANLSALNQSDLHTFLGTFSEAKGLQPLRVTDGDSVVWRVQARVLRVEMQTPNMYDVVLRVPNPVWETDALATDTTLLNTTNAPSSSPASTAITPGGNRDAYPVVTMTPDANKTFALKDYAFNLQGFFVSRQPFEGRIPVWLFDQAGAQARLATDSSATGATVKQTTGATSIAADISAGATTITLTSAASWPNKGMGYLTDSRGNGFHDQFYYDGISGAVLQNVVWLPAMAAGGEGTVLTGGGIAHTQAQETAIQPSGIVLDGRDCRVWLNGSEVNRWLVGWNTSASDVVVNYDMPAAVTLTLAAAVTSGQTGTVRFVENVSRLSGDAGFLVLENEVVHYSAKVGANGLTIDARGLWGTTAASHAANVIGYADPVRVVVAVGKATADAAPSPASERPCCQLPGSSNQRLLWGNASDDASTVFFDRANPSRTVQWVPGFDSDGNDVSPLMSISASSNILTFKDDVPGDGASPANYALITVPQGIMLGTSGAISMDWTPSAEVLNLELFTRDAAGVWKLQDQLQQSAGAVGRALPAALLQPAYGAKLKARYNIAWGFRGDDAITVETIANTTNDGTYQMDGTVALKLVLTRDTRIKKLQIRMNKASAGTQVVDFVLRGDSGGAPDTNNTVYWANATTQITVSGTTPTTYEIPLGRRALYKAGTYWLVLILHTTYNQVQLRGSNAYGAQDHKILLRTAGAWQVQDDDSAWFNAVNDYDSGNAAPVEIDQPVLIPATGARTATTASFDNPNFLLHTSQFAYMHRVSAFVSGASALYHNQATVSIPTTGDSYALDLWQKLAAPVVVDSALKTVTYTEDGIAYAVAGSVGADFKDAHLAPGVANTVQVYDDALVTGSSGQLDIQIAHRGRKE